MENKRGKFKVNPKAFSAEELLKLRLDFTKDGPKLWMKEDEINKQLKITMEKNDIKKALYKQSVIANFEYIKKGKAYYSAVLSFTGTGTKEDPITPKTITFEIPTEDMGDAKFEKYMDAKLLIRWIV